MTNERIAVGIDFSAPSLETARWVAQQFPGTELVLVHVISVPAPPAIVSSRYPRRDLMVDTLREGADVRLRSLAGSLQLRTWLEIREGEVASELAEVASAYGARFVALGAHGERPRAAGTIGTTAQQVVRTAAIPVMLVLATERPIGRILVAVDDSDLSAESLRWAARIGERSGAHVTALHVTPAGVMSHALAAAAVVSGVPNPTMPHGEADQPPDRWIELARASGVPADRVTSEQAFGDAAMEIVAASERLGADLVIMGRRRAGGLRRAVLGSVTEAVLGHATCSVLVIPEPETSEG